MSRLLLLALLVATLFGCDSSIKFARVEAPGPEVPVANLPAVQHQRNWEHPLNRQGSCVHASTIAALRWTGQDDLAEKWRKTYAGGETANSIMSIYRKERVPFAFTTTGDPAFLEWVTETRRAAIIWWKTYHCCTFVGFSVVDGREVAGVIDNNNPGVIEYTPKAEFIRKWRTEFGGFSAAPLLSPPASPLLHKGFTRGAV